MSRWAGGSGCHARRPPPLVPRSNAGHNRRLDRGADRDTYSPRSSGGSHDASARRRRPWRSVTVILVAAWHIHILTHDVDYDGLGPDWFTRNVNDHHRRDHAIRSLHDLGYRVTLERVA